MIKSILNQLIGSHKDAGTVHLGCSKFKSFATGSLKGLLHERNTTAELAYLDHVQAIGSFVKDTFPKIRPVVWDDTLNKIKVEVLMNHKMPDYADIAIQAQLNDVSLGNLFYTYNIYCTIERGDSLGVNNMVFRCAKAFETTSKIWKNIRQFMGCIGL